MECREINMSLKVYLIRHGETDFVKSGKVWGLNDKEELNEIGAIQIKKMSYKLKGIEFDKVYTSDLKRTTQTAKIICG